MSKHVNSSFPLSDRYFSGFWLVISAKYVVLFILGKCLLDEVAIMKIAFFDIFGPIWTNISAPAGPNIYGILKQNFNFQSLT